MVHERLGTAAESLEASIAEVQRVNLANAGCRLPEKDVGADDWNAVLRNACVVEGAEKAQCAALWHMTKWYGEAERPDDVMLLATFALKELRAIYLSKAFEI